MNPSWTRTITVATGQVPSTQTDFPVLFSVDTDNDFRTIGNGGKMQKADAADFAIFSDSALTTICKQEKDGYNATNGQLKCWLKWSSLSDSSVRYIGFGDAAQSTSLDDKNNVWVGFSWVHHFGFGSLDLTDSTGNGKTYTNIGSTPAGEGRWDASNGGVVTNGTNQYLKLGVSGIARPFAWSLWLKNPGTTHVQFSMMSDDGSSNRYDGFYCYNSPPPAATIVSNNNFTAGQWVNLSTSGTWTGANWNYLAIAFISASSMKFYLNGNSPAADSTTSVTPINAMANFALGALFQHAATDFSAVTFDEIHGHSSARSNDWFAVEYNNMSAPGTFLTLSSSTGVSSSSSLKRNSYLAGIGASGSFFQNPLNG